MFSQSRIKISSTNIYEGNYLTSPTLIGADQNTHLNTLFYTNHGRNANDDHHGQEGNLLTFDNLNLLNDKHEGNVTIERWARTRRQRIIKDISFESEVFNIYDPKFSSDEEDNHSDVDSLMQGCNII